MTRGRRNHLYQTIIYGQKQVRSGRVPSMIGRLTSGRISDAITPGHDLVWPTGTTRWLHLIRRQGLRCTLREFRSHRHDVRHLGTIRKQQAPVGDLSALFEFAAINIPGGPSQDQIEFVPFLGMAAECRPITIVEIGTEAGGTTFLLANGLTSAKTVVGVDRFVRNARRIDALSRPGVSIAFVEASSHLSHTVAAVKARLDNRPIDLLFIDGDHSFAGALADFRAYGPHVRDGGLIVFHDIVPDERLRNGQQSLAYAGEVPILWRLLRNQYNHKEFVADPTQEGRGIGVLVQDRQIVPAVV
jgi:predicted O-methyltransferase YrrM